MPKLGPLEEFDAWELEEKLAHARRILGPATARETPDSNPVPDRPDDFAAYEAGASRTVSVVWALTKLAVSAITCGGILAAWWWIAGRQDLIKPALAALAVGHLAWLGKWCCEARPAATA